MAISSSSQFYFTPYFIINLLLLVAYPMLRIFTAAGRKNLKHQDYFGFSYENSIIYTVLILAIMGYVRSTSTRGFLVEVLTVGKVGVAALLVFAKFKYSIIYSIICIVAWLVVPYPHFSAPNKFIRIKSIEQFDDIINSYKK